MKKRNISLDVIRIFALFCVISVHFFLNSDYYNTTIFGKRMYVITLVRSFFMICVPLFLLLTGYLMNKKRVCKKYYLGIVKTLFVYFMASIFCYVYKILFLGFEFSFFSVIKGSLGFIHANYSWYIEMYIGLFMLIPFLNLIYNNLDNKIHKKWLIVSLLILTSLPGIINCFSINYRLGWGMFLNRDLSYDKIIPSWWVNIYPITYYYIGCYLKEYGLSIKRYLNVLLIIVVTILFGSYCYMCSKGSNFIWGSYQDFNSLYVVILAVLVFNLILNINFNKLSKIWKRIIKNLSDCCLGGYLVSYIFDNYLYNILNTRVNLFYDRFNYIVIIVPIIFILSISLSSIINVMYDLLMKIRFKNVT